MRKGIVAAVIAALVGGLWWSGILGRLAEPAAIQAAVEAAGLWGPLLYIALSMGLFGVFMLAPPVWASAALWPLPLAFGYSYVASLLASVLTYFAMRRFGREWARERIPPRIKTWEERLRARPFATVMSLRLLLWANPLVDMLAAVTDIPPRSYLISTFIGLLIPTAFHVAIGAGGMAAVSQAPAWLWAVVAGLVGAGALIYRQAKNLRSEI